MKRVVQGLIAAGLLAVIIVSGCRPPDVEGTVVNLQKSQWEAAYESAQAAIEKNPNNAEAWFYWGYINGEHKNNFDEMNRGFDKALEIDPTKTVSLADQGITQTAEVAIRDYRTTKFAEQFNPAIKKLQQAQQSSDEAERTKLYGEVAEKMALAMEIDPTRHEPFQPLAISTLGIGDTARAVVMLDEGLERMDDTEELLLTAGKVYLLAKQTEKAKTTFERALEHNPNNAIIYQELGNMSAAAGDWEVANAHYERAIELDPDNADLAYNIGLGYYKQQQYAEALPFFTQAIDPNAEDPLVHRLVGSCYIQAQQYDEGMTFLEGAVEAFPEEPTLWEFLAIAYGQKGMSEEADEAFQKSKTLSGE